MENIYHSVSFKTSRMITHTYSTSFSIGVKCLDGTIQDAIYSIYGFVRLADEIVDSFHDYNKEKLLRKFENDYYEALKYGICLNPVINAFRDTVTRYRIEDELIQSFMHSMKTDLAPVEMDKESFKKYVYGSAEAVGLMCLKVFVNGNQERYRLLEPYARRLGAAFQKINFLRDIYQDTNQLNRNYFPVLQGEAFSENTKKYILADIYEDYRVAEKGIRQLPECARLGVYVAYLYYRRLTEYIAATPVHKLMHSRIRVSNREKLYIFGKAYIHSIFQ